MLKRVFHLLLARLGVRRLRGHSFFGTILPRPAVVADLGAHCGEFFAAVKAQHPVWRALLVEADPALAQSLMETFGHEADVLQAALVGQNREPTITFTRSMQPEASSIYTERVAVYGTLNQVEVPTVDFAEVVRQLGGRVDLAKLDVEAAEFEVLETAHRSDLAACGQLTVEFHDSTQPITRLDVGHVCQRLRCAGYGIVNANWPYFDDVLFVNFKRMTVGRRLRFRCRMMLVNLLFIFRGTFFWCIRAITNTR
jgi:FkbM family methyltransferase